MLRASLAKRRKSAGRSATSWPASRRARSTGPKKPESSRTPLRVKSGKRSTSSAAKTERSTASRRARRGRGGTPAAGRDRAGRRACRWAARARRLRRPRRLSCRAPFRDRDGAIIARPGGPAPIRRSRPFAGKVCGYSPPPGGTHEDQSHPRPRPRRRHCGRGVARAERRADALRPTIRRPSTRWATRSRAASTASRSRPPRSTC